jgi:hypothetical protein
MPSIEAVGASCWQLPQDLIGIRDIVPMLLRFVGTEYIVHECSRKGATWAKAITIEETDDHGIVEFTFYMLKRNAQGFEVVKKLIAQKIFDGL